MTIVRNVEFVGLYNKQMLIRVKNNIRSYSHKSHCGNILDIYATEDKYTMDYDPTLKIVKRK